MGNNTVGLFLNDFVGEIERRSNLGYEIGLALKSGSAREIGGQALTLLQCSHADNDQVIMAGGNRITTITVLRDCEHTAEALLHKLAAHLGYELRKPHPHTGSPSA